MELTHLLGGTAFVVLGIYMVARPSNVAEKLRVFYSKYPLVRYAGQRQLTSRTSYIVVLGLLFVAIGIFGTFMSF